MSQVAQQKLYETLYNAGKYTKSFDEFVNQFSSDQAQNSLYGVLNKAGHYTKSEQEFKQQFFSDVTIGQETPPPPITTQGPTGPTVLNPMSMPGATGTTVLNPYVQQPQQQQGPIVPPPPPNLVNDIATNSVGNPIAWSGKGEERIYENYIDRGKGYEWKYEVDADMKITYYSRPTGSRDWIKIEPNTYDYDAAGGIFGFTQYDVSAGYERQKLLEENQYNNEMEALMDQTGKMPVHLTVSAWSAATGGLPLVNVDLIENEELKEYHKKKQKDKNLTWDPDKQRYVNKDEFVNKRKSEIEEEKRIKNLSYHDDLTSKNWKTFFGSNKTLTQIHKYLEVSKDFPGLRIVASDNSIDNALEITTPDGSIKHYIRFDPNYMKESIRQLNEIKHFYTTYEAKSTDILSTVFEGIEGEAGLSNFNFFQQGLTGLFDPTRIFTDDKKMTTFEAGQVGQINKTLETLGYGIDTNRSLLGAITGYNIYKDGKYINTVDSANATLTWFQKNLSEEELNKLRDQSLIAANKVIEERDEFFKGQYESMSMDDATNSFYKSNDLIANIEFDLKELGISDGGLQKVLEYFKKPGQGAVLSDGTSLVTEGQTKVGYGKDYTYVNTYTPIDGWQKLKYEDILKAIESGKLILTEADKAAVKSMFESETAVNGEMINKHRVKVAEEKTANYFDIHWDKQKNTNLVNVGLDIIADNPAGMYQDKYIYNEKEYTREEIEEIAEREGVEIEKFLKENNVQIEKGETELLTTLQGFVESKDKLLSQAMDDMTALQTKMKNVYASAQEAGCFLQTVGVGDKARVIVTHEDAATQKYWQGKIAENDNILKNILNEQLGAIENFSTLFNKWASKVGGLQVISKKEHNLAQILKQEFMDGFSQMFYGIGAAFGSDYSKQQLRNIQHDKQYLEAMPEWQFAAKHGYGWSFALRTLSQQGANTIVAIGTSALGLPPGITTLATAGIFGLSSGGQKVSQLEGYVIDAEKARKEKEELLANKVNFIASYGYNTYRSTLLQLENTISMGDLTPAQIRGAAWTAGIIEGGIMSLMGTLPNARAIIGDLSGAVDDIGKIIMRSNYGAAWDVFSTIGKRTFGEIMEEELIYISDNIAMNLITGQDMDWSQFDDVLVSSLIMGGVMNGPSVITSNIKQQMVTADIRAQYGDIKSQLNLINEQLAELGYTEADELLRSQLITQRETLFNELLNVDNSLEIDALVGGGDDTKALIQNQLNLDELYRQAGVTPDMSPSEKQKRINDHVEGLSGEKKKNFQDKLNFFNNQKQKIQDGIASKYDNDNIIEQVYGKNGVAIMEKLSKEIPGFDKLTNKEKMLEIHKVVKQNVMNKSVEQVKNNDGQRDAVEKAWQETKKIIQGRRAQADAEGVTKKTGRTEDWGGKTMKELENDFKEAEYQRRATQLLGNKVSAKINFNKQQSNAADILGDKLLSELEMTVAENQDELRLKVYQAVQEGEITFDEAESLIDGLETGKDNALIIGNKYIVLDEKAALEALENGNLLQGTAIAHEISHFIDDTAMDRDQLNDYAEKLEGYSSKNISKVDKIAKRQLSSLDTDHEAYYDPTKSFKDQSDTAKDEYTKRVQDLLMSKPFESDLKKVSKLSQGFGNMMRGVVGADYNINTEKDAMVWMSSFINSFNNGEISKIQKRKMKAAKKAEIDKKTGYKKSSNLQGILEDKYEGKKSTKGDIRKMVREMTSKKPDGKKADNLDESQLGQEIGGVVEAVTRKLFDPIPNDATKIINENRKEARRIYKEAALIEAASIIEGEYLADKMDMDKWTTIMLNNRLKPLAKSLGVESTVERGGTGITVNIEGTQELEADPDMTDEFDDMPSTTPALDNLDLDTKTTNKILDAILTVIGTKLPDLDLAVSKNKAVSPLIAELKKQFGIKNGPIYKAILDVIGKNPKDVKKWLVNPKNRNVIFSGMTTTWLAKNLPNAIEKKVNGIGWTINHKVDEKGKKRTKGTKPGQIDFWRSTEDGPYKGMTDGKQKMRRNPDVMTDVNLEALEQKFANGETMTDVKRNGLDALVMAISQEVGMELFNKDLQEDGKLKEIFEGRQELFDRVLKDNYVQEIAKQTERGTVKHSTNTKGELFIEETHVDENVGANTIRYFELRKEGNNKEADNIKGLIPENTVDAIDAIIEMNPDLLNEPSGFYGQIIAEATNLPQEFKNAVKDKELNIFKGKKRKPKTLKTYVDNTVDFFSKIDNRLLSRLGAGSKFAEIAGFINRYADPAKKKAKTGKEGVGYKSQQKLNNKNTKEDLDFVVSDVNPINKDSKWMKEKLDSIWKLESKDQKLKKIDELRDEIMATNVANIKAFKHIILKLAEPGVDLKYVYQLFQANTANIVNGFRALSRLDYILVEEGVQALPNKITKTNIIKDGIETDKYKKYKENCFKTNHFKDRYNIHIKEGKARGLEGVELEANAMNKAYVDVTPKGEHVGPSSNTMFNTFMLLANKQATPGKIENVLQPHGQLFAPNFICDMIDQYTDEQNRKLKKTSKENELRLTIALPASILKNIVDIATGRPAANVIAEKNNIVEKLVPEEFVEKSQKIDDAKKNARTTKHSTNPKGISILDFDDTLATTKSRVITIAPDGTKGYMNAEQYAKGYTELLAQGYKFDFSEFSKVIKGKIAPLFQKALKLQGKFGPENMFVLTARPADSALAIHEFLKANGLNIPLKNITGLANSTSEAKALWVLNKVGEGYNDFYFADDALQNVQAVKNVLDQTDVKSKIQQAKAKRSANADDIFNQILEDTFDVAKEKRFSAAKGRQRGRQKGRFNWFIPPSAEDFKGLMYGLLSKGVKGEKQLEFFNEMLMKPFSRASQEVDLARVTIMSDYKNLRKEMPNVRKKLNKKIPGTEYTYDQGIRVYIWDKLGFKIPGLTKTDKAKILKALQAEPDTKLYADTLSRISKLKKGWVEPSDYWLTENIASNMTEIINTAHRQDALSEFKENRKQIFGEWKGGKLVGPNMAKLEAIKGPAYIEALTDILWRMENGTNRNFGKDKLTNSFTNWVNGSIGAIMFFNQRSAVLQLLSSINYVNYADNNLINAGKAFANQKQYWTDFAFLWNSPTLVARRAGLRGNIETSEIALAAEKGGPKAVFAYMLKLGFTPTQIADSFAICSGGAAMYRNRVNKYLKDGLSKKEAETKAFEDFNELTQEAQQSSRADKISQQQAGPLGRWVLAFQNTPMQYTRLSKRDMQDLINRRKIPGKTLAQSDKIRFARIAYYMAVQNMIFGALQAAMFRFIFEEDDEEKQKKEVRIVNGMLDTILRGTGVYGAIVSTLKNMILKYVQTQEKGNFDESAVVMEFLNLSPPIGSKARKIVSAMKTLQYQRDEIDNMSKFNINNPMWQVVGNITSGTTNIPLDRVVNKLINIKEAMDSDNAAWQRIALINGWNTWDLNVTPDDLEKAREEIEIIKSEKEIEKKEADKKRKEKERLEKLRQGKFDYLTDEEFEVVQKRETLTKLNKSEQVNMLMELGLTTKEIKTLKYEADRVNKIIELTKNQ